MGKKRKEVCIRPDSWLLLYRMDRKATPLPFVLIIYFFTFLFRETKTNQLDSASQLPLPWRNLAEAPGERCSLTDTDAYA